MKMRVLVLSALLACAAAAPSYVAPLPLSEHGVFKTNFPTVGDYQAAVIDAQVEIANHRRDIADKSRQALESKLEEDQQILTNTIAKIANTETVYGNLFKTVPQSLGLAPYSYQAVVPPVGYAQLGLRAYPGIPAFQQIHTPFYNPTIYKTVY